MIELLLTAENALALGLLDQAERTFRQVLDADPRNGIAAVGLARVAVERGDDSGALALANAALEIDPENATARRMIQRLEEVAAYRAAAAVDVAAPSAPSAPAEPAAPAVSAPEAVSRASAASPAAAVSPAAVSPAAGVAAAPTGTAPAIDPADPQSIIPALAPGSSPPQPPPGHPMVTSDASHPTARPVDGGVVLGPGAVGVDDLVLDGGRPGEPGGRTTPGSTESIRPRESSTDSRQPGSRAADATASLPEPSFLPAPGPAPGTPPPRPAPSAAPRSTSPSPPAPPGPAPSAAPGTPPPGPYAAPPSTAPTMPAPTEPAPARPRRPGLLRRLLRRS